MMGVAEVVCVVVVAEWRRLQRLPGGSTTPRVR